MADRMAVLLLAHGTPDSLDEVPEYLRNVTGGRPIPDAVIEEVRHRTSMIGKSPLTKLTQEQGRLLAKELGVPVYVGMRNWRPYIADVVKQMLEDGTTSAVVICLAPQNSRTSVGLYKRAVMQAVEDRMRILFIEAWADHPLLAEAFADRLRPVWERVSNETGAPVPVVFTAHSVPQRTVEAHDGQPADPYAEEAKRTAASVAERVPELRHWRFAFQSQGMSGGPWLGPTVEETLTALHQEGHKAVVIQPIGFLCDHIEVLYDIDIAFREFGKQLGMRIERPESLNNSPLLIGALADIARQGLAQLAS
ncbi:MAG TPA: ferrochelatase [Pseudacidobacterium sp.]|nr:ferrochelatase [Pseudacidobacterium sp.]